MTHRDKKCLRTFYGHTEAVRGIDFNYDGTKFISFRFPVGSRGSYEYENENICMRKGIREEKRVKRE